VNSTALFEILGVIFDFQLIAICSKTNNPTHKKCDNKDLLNSDCTRLEMNEQESERVEMSRIVQFSEANFRIENQFNRAKNPSVPDCLSFISIE
jgi:hypothetical protein